VAELRRRWEVRPAAAQCWQLNSVAASSPRNLGKLRKPAFDDHQILEQEIGCQASHFRNGIRVLPPEFPAELRLATLQSQAFKNVSDGLLGARKRDAD